MIIRQLKLEKFLKIQRQLVQKARQDPLDACFHVTITVNKKEYVLRIQTDQKQRLVALQALEIDRSDELGHLHTLITNNRLLASLLELVIWQGVA